MVEAATNALTQSTQQKQWKRKQEMDRIETYQMALNTAQGVEERARQIKEQIERTKSSMEKGNQFI